MAKDDLIKRLMGIRLTEDKADDILKPHTPEVRQQKKDASLKRAKQMLGPEGVDKIKHIIRTLILKPLMVRDLGELIDDEVWRETIDVDLYPDVETQFHVEDEEDWDDIISSTMLSYLEQIRDAIEEILDA